MSHIVTLEYTETLLREAVFAFWKRTVGVGFFVALALVLGSLAFLVWRGDRSCVVGALGAIAVLGLGFAFVLYWAHLRNTMAKFRGIGAPVATLTLDDERFGVSSGLGTASMPWSSVIEVWRFPTFWLLMLSKAQFVTIPLGTVSSEMQAFIISRVCAAGGKVVG